MCWRGERALLLDVLIVEDNELFLNVNLKYVKQIAIKYNVGLNIKTYTYAGEGLVQFIRESRIDVAILDIDLGHRNGISIGKEIIRYHSLVNLIFITSYGEYIRKANKLSPVGFIDKPVDYKKMEKILYRVFMEKWGRECLESQNAQIITLKCNRECIEVRESEILYIRVSGRKLYVATKKDKLYINNTINGICNELSDMFVKVCRDTIVNKREVIGLVQGCITMSDNAKLEIPLYNHKSIVKKIRS